MRRRDSAAVNRISRVCWTTMAAIMELPCGQHLITLISGPIQGTTFRSRRLREPRPTVVDGFRRSKPIRRRTEVRNPVTWLCLPFVVTRCFARLPFSTKLAESAYVSRRDSSTTSQSLTPDTVCLSNNCNNWKIFVSQ